MLTCICNHTSYVITHLQVLKQKQKHLCEQAQKEWKNGIIRKISQFDLFDKVVVPVLHVLYGSEVWGFEKLNLMLSNVYT